MLFAIIVSIVLYFCVQRGSATGSVELIDIPDQPKLFEPVLFAWNPVTHSIFFGKEQVGLSESKDGGLHWARKDDGSFHAQVSRFPDGGSLVVQPKTGALFSLLDGGQTLLLKSTDGGLHWSGIPNEEMHIRAQELKFDREDPTLMFLKAELIGEGEDPVQEFHFMISTDGGDSFRSLPNVPHQDDWQHLAVSHQAVCALAQNAVFCSRDRGQTWKDIGFKALKGTDVYGSGLYFMSDGRLVLFWEKNDSVKGQVTVFTPDLSSFTTRSIEPLAMVFENPSNGWPFYIVDESPAGLSVKKLYEDGRSEQIAHTKEIAAMPGDAPMPLVVDFDHEVLLVEKTNWAKDRRTFNTQYERFVFSK